MKNTIHQKIVFMPEVTRAQYIEHHQKHITQLQEKLKRDYNQLDYVALNELISSIKKRNKIIAFAKSGKMDNYFISRFEV